MFKIDITIHTANKRDCSIGLARS